MLKDLMLGAWAGFNASLWILALSAILVRVAYYIADRPISGPLF